MFNKKVNVELELAKTEYRRLYVEREKYDVVSKEYAAITKQINQESQTIENLTKDKVKNKINWEPWVGSAIGLAGNVGIAVLMMNMQIDGHLPDYKIMTMFKSRV